MMRDKRANVKVWTWMVMALIAVNIAALTYTAVAEQPKLAPFLPEGKTWDFTPFRSIALRVLTGTLFGLVIALGLLMRHNYKATHPASMVEKYGKDDGGDNDDKPEQKIFQAPAQNTSFNPQSRTGQMIKSPMPNLPNANSNRFSSGI